MTTEGDQIATALNRLARRVIVAFVLAAFLASAALAGDAGPTRARSAQVTVVERDGFDWADAGIGALGAFGVMFVLTGLAFVVHPSCLQARSKRRLS